MRTNGLVFSVERGSIHDGPGIRTTVFLKGCPLHCLWCHNPESQSFYPELYFLSEKCTGCGRCACTCSRGCHNFNEGIHEILRNTCDSCGECVRSCPYSALEIKGEDAKAEAILSIVAQDADFYHISGGGLTVSGGEPLSQFDFTYALLSMAKQKGIHTCIETCGFVPTGIIMRATEVTDIFLYDFKESNAKKHKKFTGVDNALILKNLFEIDRMGARIILRCPIIPGLNDRQDHFLEIAHIAEGLKNILEINIMPYHPMGSSKSRRIGRQYPLEGLGFAEKSEVEKWIGLLKENTKIPVKKG